MSCDIFVYQHSNQMQLRQYSHSNLASKRSRWSHLKVGYMYTPDNGMHSLDDGVNFSDGVREEVLVGSYSAVGLFEDSL